MASPAVHSRRTSTSRLIDPREHGDYPILLGDSLKGDNDSPQSLLNIRYNWQPKSGFLDGRRSKLRKTDDAWSLDVSTGESGSYHYVAKNPQQQSGKSEDMPRSLALFFDEAKSAFVLEAVSATLDMNIQRGPDVKTADVRALPQLPMDLRAGHHEQSTNRHASSSSEDEAPDKSNPYDFRHFLQQAREAVGNSTQAPGNRTPLPGSHTPLSGASTPMLNTNRHLSTTPQFKPTSGTSTSKTSQQKKKKLEKNEIVARYSRSSGKVQAKRDSAKASQTLSKDRVSDSDDSDDNTIAVPRSSQAAAQAKPARSIPTKGHARHVSDNIGSSPHIIINDDDGGLEIDMGSPPPEDDRFRRRGRVDPEMFRSHTGTPIAGLSSNLGSVPRSTSRPISRTPMVDDADNGRRRERDGDVRMKDIEAASEDDDNDNDVDDFILGSPARRIESKEVNDKATVPQHHMEESVPTPSKAPDADEDDDEDLLEAELEAALEEENNNHTEGVGLGIGMTGSNLQDDDESEVSEEE